MRQNSISVQTVIKNAQLLCKHGEFASAEELLRQVLHLEEDTPLAVYWLQFCLEAQGNFDEASTLHEGHRAKELEKILRQFAPYYTDYDIHTGLIAVYDENDGRLASFKTNQEAEAFIKNQMGL